MTPGPYGVNSVVYAQSVLGSFEKTSPNHVCIEAPGSSKSFHGPAGAQTAEQ